MSPYLRQICEYLERTRGSLTPTQAEALFGRPTGGSTVSQLLSNAERNGRLVSANDGRGRIYRWRDGACGAASEPQFAGIGRNGRRVASVWEYAQEVAV